MKEIKSDWIDQFIEKLHEHHGKDYHYFVEDKNYPLQLAVAYFDWVYDEEGNAVEPEYTVEEAFTRYVEYDEC